ncbi:single-stranded DNA-binding protein [Candidatus Saccharibacteria bacterium]|nr:single-stranded DNA-binding protein [Candidatus Saccharibacteria bacterium]
MRGFSKAIITGNLTRDPELRTIPNGTNVCSFTVAVNRLYKDSSGNQQEAVSFIDCSAWGRLGEMISQYAKKGTGVLVSGRLDQRSWEDKNGQKRSRVEIVVEDFNFTGPASNGGRSGGDGGSSYGGDDVRGMGNDAAAEEAPASDEQSGKADEEIDLSNVPF